MTDHELNDLQEWIEERAAILELEAEMLRQDAERMARELARERFAMDDRPEICKAVFKEPLWRDK